MTRGFVPDRQGEVTVRNRTVRNRVENHLMTRFCFLIAVFLVPAFSFAQTKDFSLVRDVRSAATALLGHPVRVVNVLQAEEQGLNQKNLRHQPWSGSFWPDIIGGIANHYRDHTKLGNQFRYLLRYELGSRRVWRDFRNVCTNYSRFSGDELNRKLSPAEKYDLLIGDAEFSFSKAVLDDIDFRARHLKKYKTIDGSGQVGPGSMQGAANLVHYADDPASYVPYDRQVQYRYWKPRKDSISWWFGICDGWAPASVYLPRPVNPVTVTGALGHRITFYPDDLKALGSYLFARTNNDYMSSMRYRFTGRPCAEIGAPRADQKGYVRDFRCNDVDPGLFHLVLLNRIGLDGMGFMMDIDNNRKINNHPVAAYKLSYYNVLTKKEGSVAKSIVPRNRVEDAYQRRRNAKTAFILGVKAEIRYQHYVWPEDNRHRSTDSPAFDKSKGRVYRYDLELDANGDILGGEWGDRSIENGKTASGAGQPDFLWMASTDALPYSEQSLYVSAGSEIDPARMRPFGNMNWAWNGAGPMPEDWIRAARADARWEPPAVGSFQRSPGGGVDIFPAEARDSILKPAQPLSTIVYYLFDQARAPGER